MAVVPVPDGQPAPGGFLSGGLGNILGQFVRLFVVFQVTQWAFKRAVPDANSYTDGGRRGDVSRAPALVASYNHGERIDFWVYITETPGMGDFHDPEGKSLVWSETGVALGDVEERTKHIDIPTPQHVLNNGTMYVHSFFTRTGLSPDPRAPNYDQASTFGRTTTLIKYVKPKKKSNKKNLLSSSEEEEEGGGGAVVAMEDEDEDEDLAMALWEPHWKPNCTINLVDDYTRYEGMQVPPTIKPHMHVNPATNQYFPMVFYNDFWLLNDKFIKVNETVESLPLTLSFGSITLFKWQMMLQMEESFRMQKQMGSMSEGESDEFKRVLIEGNPYLLALTGGVSLLHTVFDILAFKNDIGFWKKNKSMEGLSLRSIVVNAFCQVVILLYLWDNDTSWLILFSSTLGVIIEFWKLTKAMHVSFSLAEGIKFKSRDSYVKSDTQKWDEEAMKYMSYVMYPLIGCYAVYSLIYNEHKGWYSFVLSTLVGCVYAFGFIMMCPQLYINYKMKSVAHLPWRQMTYKFLNTIIDDLFAFVIKMPTLHRLSVFRDDLIFLIYLYQRWKYPVDKSRVNEFGFSDQAPEGAAVEGAAATKALEGAAAEGAAEGGGGEGGGEPPREGGGGGSAAADAEPKKEK